MSTSTALDDSHLELALTVAAPDHEKVNIHDIIEKAWSTIAPSWPIKEFVASNPLQGFVDMPIEEALKLSSALFQQENIPEPIHSINRETIKWCQAFFDEGQAAISMPNRELGLYNCWRRLAVWDDKLHGGDKNKIQLLKNLTDNSEDVISQILSMLKIPEENQELFLILALTTLPGWAAHVKYRNECQHDYHAFKYKATLSDYLAARVVMTALLWPDALDLIHWHQTCLKDNHNADYMHLVSRSEDDYTKPLINQLRTHINAVNKKIGVPDAQFVFCIDVRSEPLREAIESVGNYETFGYAGFFGLPVAFEDRVTQEVLPSCPVILKSKHVLPLENTSKKRYSKKKQAKQIKNVFQGLKYNFTTPLALAELLGLPAGLWMTLQNFFPRYSSKIKQKIMQPAHKKGCCVNHDSEAIGNPNIETESKEIAIPFNDQLLYAETLLKTMGMIHITSPLVIFCGHGCKTENNAFSSALECGACGGRNGTGNAKVVSEILNRDKIQEYLKTKGITISGETLFIAGEHNTTTNEIQLHYHQKINQEKLQEIELLKSQLDVSRDLCNAKFNGLIEPKKNSFNATKKAQVRSSDWSQTRPEWGLANNAAMVVGPRYLTKDIDLQGRSFLQSYDWQHDSDGSLLASIIGGPVVVAHWINSQYLFSSLDNVAFGSGSKVTKNITGKIGIIQGNGSDLMHGLPLQSVNQCDKTPYHTPCRLTTIVYSPLKKVDSVLSENPSVKKLIKNGWLRLFCIDPLDQIIYQLSRKNSENEWIQH